MKRIIAIALVSFGFLSMTLDACSSRKAEPHKGEEFQAKDEHVANGERIFMEHCQKCHPGGEAGLGPAINSNPAPQFVKRFQMRHGIGVMPSFTEKEISEDNLRDISDYLKALKSY